ncbi:hypothetical protein [Natronococcus sp. A-GB7]|uniref:hypothetical protein n=1 Tax=Natronococcus sp. A-GB7 TaxID=3037649 RepID=UPI00241D9EDF|nr:hypothetical protein [Natronococcus sp. A-GB7]MDG5821640.1 hypothetical protein [Natronococcus sp. A-GB7]
MITDARPLQPEFVPGHVRHRDGEINTLTSNLKPILNGNHADPAFLHGPSSTGKTCMAQHAVERLREQVVDLHTQYVNCWEDYTRFKTSTASSKDSTVHMISTANLHPVTNSLTASETPS